MFLTRTDVKVQRRSYLSPWRRLPRAGTGPGTANMEHLLSFQLKSFDCLNGSFPHWTSVLRFDTIVRIHPSSPLSLRLLASDLFFVSLAGMCCVRADSFLRHDRCAPVYHQAHGRLQLFLADFIRTHAMCSISYSLAILSSMFLQVVLHV